MALTLDGNLLNSRGMIGPAEFEVIMRREMHTYTQTRLSDFSDCRTAADLELTSIGALKTLLSEVLVMASGQREMLRELREVHDSLQRSLQSSGSVAPPAKFSSSVPPALGIAKQGVFKAPSASGPKLTTLRPEAGEAELALTEGGQMIPEGQQAVLAAALQGLSCPAANALAQLSARRPSMLSPAELGVFGLGCMARDRAVAMSDRVAEEPGTVMAAIDTLSVEVAGLVSNICGRAAAIGSDVASLAAKPMLLAKATVQAADCQQAQVDTTGLPQPPPLLPASTPPSPPPHCYHTVTHAHCRAALSPCAQATAFLRALHLRSGIICTYNCCAAPGAGCGSGCERRAATPIEVEAHPLVQPIVRKPSFGVASTPHLPLPPTSSAKGQSGSAKDGLRALAKSSKRNKPVTEPDPSVFQMPVKHKSNGGKTSASGGGSEQAPCTN